LSLPEDSAAARLHDRTLVIRPSVRNPAYTSYPQAGFFVLSVDLRRGRVGLSDGSEDELDISSLRGSAIDGAWLCSVKRDLVRGGLPARFMHPAQAELMNAIDQRRGELAVEVAGEWLALPPLD
jgi:hypothetical protein